MPPKPRSAKKADATPGTFRLMPATRAQLAHIEAATGANTTAVLGQAVAALYRDLFGVEALRGLALQHMAASENVEGEYTHTQTRALAQRSAPHDHQEADARADAEIGRFDKRPDFEQAASENDDTPFVPAPNTTSPLTPTMAAVPDAPKRRGRKPKTE